MKPHDRISKDWLKFAEQDLKAARLIFNEKIYNLACFPAQQVIEKALKAHISNKSVPPRTHFLGELLDICIKENESFEKFKESCLIADQYYIPSRYPIALVGTKPNGMPNKADAEKVIVIAEEIINHVKGIIA